MVATEDVERLGGRDGLLGLLDRTDSGQLKLDAEVLLRLLLHGRVRPLDAQREDAEGDGLLLAAAAAGREGGATEAACTSDGGATDGTPLEQLTAAEATALLVLAHVRASPFVWH